MTPCGWFRINQSLGETAFLFDVSNATEQLMYLYWL